MTTVIQEDGWTYDLVSIDTDVSNFGNFGKIVSLWNDKRVENRLPAWRDFVAEELMEWWSGLTVFDVDLDASNLGTYRLWGESLVKMYQVELTGKSFMEPDSGWDSADKLIFWELVKGKSICTCSGPVFWQNREYRVVESLRLPLADDGRNVDKLLGLTLDISRA